MNPFINEQLSELLYQFGLQEVDQRDVEIPISELDGKIGALYGESLYYGLYGLKDVLAKQMKTSSEEVESLLNDYRQEMKTRRMYGKYTRIYGRKLIKQL